MLFASDNPLPCCALVSECQHVPLTFLLGMCSLVLHTVKIIRFSSWQGPQWK